MSTLKNYFSEAVRELHQVAWPTRDQAIKISITVLASTLAAAVVFGAWDALLAFGYSALVKLSATFHF